MCMRNPAYFLESVISTYWNCIIPTGARDSVILSFTSAFEAFGSVFARSAMVAWTRQASIVTYNKQMHVYYIYSPVEKIQHMNFTLLRLRLSELAKNLFFRVDFHLIYVEVSLNENKCLIVLTYIRATYIYIYKLSHIHRKHIYAVSSLLFRATVCNV